MRLQWLFDIEPIWGLVDNERFVEKISQGSRGCHIVVWYVVWENYTGHLDKLAYLVHRTRLINPSVKIVLLADRWYQSKSEQFLSAGIDEILFIDFFAVATMSRVEKFDQQLNTSWSTNRYKFLFLTGKPDKDNRIRLLWKFDCAGLLHQAIWSLFVPEDFSAPCQKLLSETDTSRFREFVAKNTGSPDLVNDDVTGMLRGSLHYCGLPFDVQIYNQSLFHVVSETHFSEHQPWITEKTWLATINYLPFIIAGDVNSLQYLQQTYGLRTFEQYLPRSDYDTIVHPDQRLDAIVENTTYWLANIGKKAYEIKNDVEYNYKQTMSVIDKNRSIIDAFLQSNNLFCTWTDLIEELDDIKLERGFFYTWYENIRDPSWPDCDTASDWHTLPEKIRQECIEVFGYVPIRVN